MMLDRSVYYASKDKGILYFLKMSCENLKEKKTNGYDYYISTMGADYVRFLNYYGSRVNIFRDKEKSLFARSIWEKFYANDRNEKIITLNKYLERFYYDSTNLMKERAAYKQLGKSWDTLKSYIKNNFSYDSDDEDNFIDKLDEIVRDIIIKCITKLER